MKEQEKALHWNERDEAGEERLGGVQRGMLGKMGERKRKEKMTRVVGVGISR